ncbi:rare lipoprotein A [Sinobacterium caligoides]|uniref:Endolytic peptidoglycan transglycosylase RlpA n=1 Tax=Sinobacterium caligoides TaxID=933926 RepID=A0A3N2DNI6_9GAMM|nr:septal ring lytic transglycosylase RlpA family protein [Sinobacterium caligoides]ROS01367.1 rare lipoprotein A [Sinobacterium caligoides]
MKVFGVIAPVKVNYGLIFVAIVTALMSGCMSTPTSTPSSGIRDEPITPGRDSAPSHRPEAHTLISATPKHEAIKRAGNRSPYKVAGIQYSVLASPKGYKERGGASWYGAKFHGRKTSNGETYNQYAMSAAHKTLPIPCYVKVTNLANNKQVIVRVNDRGPFHSKRIIDLSYAAAIKLGYVDKGVAQVEVEYVDPDQWQREQAAKARAKTQVKATPVTAGAVAHATAKPVAKAQPYLQIAAVSNRASADKLAASIRPLVSEPVQVSATQSGTTTLYRVRVGPLSSRQTAPAIQAKLQAAGFAAGHLITR